MLYNSKKVSGVYAYIHLFDSGIEVTAHTAWAVFLELLGKLVKLRSKFVYLVLRHLTELVLGAFEGCGSIKSAQVQGLPFLLELVGELFVLRRVLDAVHAESSESFLKKKFFKQKNYAFYRSREKHLSTKISSSVNSPGTRNIELRLVQPVFLYSR